MLLSCKHNAQPMPTCTVQCTLVLLDLALKLGGSTFLVLPKVGILIPKPTVRRLSTAMGVFVIFASSLFPGNKILTYLNSWQLCVSNK